MPAGQENLQEMINNVMEEYPLYPFENCKRRINDRLRGLIARRPWSGLVKYGVFDAPDQYTTGTVDTTNGSNVVSGTSTAWPFTDVVNTTLSNAITETGVQDATPASMTGIEEGAYLLIDGAASNEEAVFVISKDSTTFRANFTNTHDAAETVQQGSYAGRQFRVDFNHPHLTIVGFSSATRMLLDRPWAGDTDTDQTYEITAVYISLGRDVKEILTMVNQARHYQFQLYVPKTYLDWIDPRRARTREAYILSFHETDPGGSPLYEIYPRPTSQGAYPYIYIKQWAPLDKELDILPNGIRSDIITAQVRADAARWPRHKTLEGGIYYDLGVSDRLVAEAESQIEIMKQQDDSTNIMTLLWNYRSWNLAGGGGEDFLQSHDELSYYA